MILYEFEGKELLENAGVKVPQSQVLESPDEELKIEPPFVLKAQVLSGKRAAAGGIVVVDEISNIKFKIENLLRKEINGEKVDKVLVEEKVKYDGPEFYVSLSYDGSRGPILTVSSAGGTGIEDRPSKVYNVDPLTRKWAAGGEPRQRREVRNDLPRPMSVRVEAGNVDGEVGSEKFREIVSKMISLFFEQDCLLLEVNPLVAVGGEWIALDAKVKLDDSAFARHEEWKFSPRSVPGHNPTENEIEAKKIDEGDYRGVAGSTYFDLPGDIAILSSGGGVSLTAMDALIKNGGKPANFTEYSGNPPKEKVVKLTKVVLNKPDIHGLWIIGTIAANFTDIYETLSGIIDALHELKSQGTNLSFPIVIRRGGPRDREAFEMLRGVDDLNLILQGEETSITDSARVMAEEAKKYASAS